MKKCIKRFLYSFTIILFSLQLCAFGTKDEFALNTDTTRVYSYISLSDLLDSFQTNTKESKKKYDGKLLIVSGEFEQKTKDGFTIMIGNKNLDEIKCTPKNDKNIDFDILSYGEKIAVYGKCKIYTTIKSSVELVEVEKIVPLPSVQSKDVFFTLDGKSLDKSTAIERTLNNGKIKYYIPSYWEGIEANIKENGLGNIEGFQYVLNSSDPESLFVCYFDRNLLVGRQSIGFMNKKKIEKLIINNINGNSNIIKEASQTTYYGAKYNYYLSSISDPL